jgi:transposase InsO family protein
VSTPRLEDIELGWAEALRIKDVAWLEALLAEDFVLSSRGGVGQHVDRATWFENLAQVDTDSMEILRVEAREFGEPGVGNVAVVRALVHWAASFGTRDLTGDYELVDTFVRTEEGWRVSWRISTKVDE